MSMVAAPFPSSEGLGAYPMKQVWIISFEKHCPEAHEWHYTIVSIHASKEGADKQLAKLPPKYKNLWGEEETADYEINPHQLLD